MIRFSIAVQAILLFSTATSLAVAQSEATNSSPLPVLAIAPDSPVPAHAERPAIVVNSFESGTVSAQVRDKHGFAAILSAMHGGDNEHYDPSQLGKGIADMLVEKLLQTGQFRILDRRSDGTPGTAQFIVTGSVTKFGFEEHNVGGFAAAVATMGLLSYKQHRTEVGLTARVVNATTGEIVASMTAEGISNKGGGLRVAGLGAHGAGGVDVSSSNFRSTAIGEATERAVGNLAEKIIQQKTSY
ncbi:MAG: CsgG/HfaB family protein [Gemmatimonadaceae bacterium]